MNAAPAPIKPRIFQIVIKSPLSPTEFGCLWAVLVLLWYRDPGEKSTENPQKTGSFSYFEKLPVSLPKDSFCVEVPWNAPHQSLPLRARGGVKNL